MYAECSLDIARIALAHDRRKLAEVDVDPDAKYQAVVALAAIPRSRKLR